MWWLAYGLAAAVLAGVPAVPMVIRPGTAGIGPLGLGTLAMLGGGPGRVVDAVLVDLAEQGQIMAHEGLIDVSFGRDTHDVRLTAPSVIGNTVAAHGPADLPTLREQACRIGFVFEMEFNRLTEKGLAVSPLRREYAPAGWGLTALGTLFVVSLGLLSDHSGGTGPWLLTIPLTLLVMALVITLARLRPGYHGHDPRTARGLELLRQAAADPPDPSQATKVAIGGFAAMSDHNLRAAVQGIAPESAWAWRSRSDAGVVESLACHLASGTASSR